MPRQQAKWNLGKGFRGINNVDCSMHVPSDRNSLGRKHRRPASTSLLLFQARVGRAISKDSRGVSSKSQRANSAISIRDLVVKTGDRCASNQRAHGSKSRTFQNSH
jgi:hypothetical protein